MKRASRMLSSSVLVALSITIVWLYGGDLSPPDGPVSSTMKTLDEVEPRTPISSLPFTIDTSGSYYLTDNLIGAPPLAPPPPGIIPIPQDGIKIDADDVTLDLNGFSLIGVEFSQSGINVPSPHTNITIRNGTIRDWGFNGVNAGQAFNSQLTGLLVRGNVASGLILGQGNIVGCTSGNNGQFGIIPIIDCTVIGCTARGNGTVGIDAQQSCRIHDCVAVFNGGKGIDGRVGSIITACVANNNAIGITGTHGGAFGLTGDGITVRGCAVSSNTGDGIVVGENSLIVGNKCDKNGTGGTGAGIHVLGTDNRIEANTVTLNDFGVDVDGAGNYVTANSARGNTTMNFDVAGGNTATGNVEF